MLIGFIGDIHGRVFHTLAALATWQNHLDRRFDLIIQVGDLGAFPDVTHLDTVAHRHLAADPSEADFSRLLTATGQRADALRLLREQLAMPVYFIRGNHEDFTWLDQLAVDGETGTAHVDPFDLFRYIPDGAVLQVHGLQIGFLGGVEERTDEAAIDRDRYQSLMALEPGVLDVLVTHQGPYGSSVGHRGEVYGSPMISSLVEQTQPKYHIAGHAHTISGPSAYGSTTYLGLNSLVVSPIWYPEAQGLQHGCLASLDTLSGELLPVMDSWLPQFPTPFDFDQWTEHFVFL